jgi:predicted CoA-binding protein
MYRKTADIDRILARYRVVAMVGASDNPERPSHRVAGFLKDHGFRVIPVNPKLDSVAGEKSYPDLTSIAEPVEIVDIFRRPDDVPAIVEQAIAIGAEVVWMQECIVNEEAAARARQAGLTVIMDHCMRKELIRLLGLPDEAVGRTT